MIDVTLGARRAALATTLAFALASSSACSLCPTDALCAQEGGDRLLGAVEVVVEPGRIEVPTGGSASASLSFERTGSAGVVISIAGTLPVGTSATLSSDSVSKNRPIRLTVTATPNAQPRASAIGSVTVDVTWPGRAESLTIPVTVVEPFQLSAPPQLTVTQTGTATATIDITRHGGFSGDVAFRATGGGADWNVAFAPTTTSTASTQLRVTAASTSQLGAAPLTIIGTHGVYDASAAISVNVTPAPIDFSLAPRQTALVTAPGRTVRLDLDIGRSPSLSGEVDLDVQGLPSDVTASFAPDPAPGSAATMTLTVASTAALGGPHALTIRGVAGTLTRTTTVSLTIGPPPLVMSIAPATLDVVRGSFSSVAFVRLIRTGVSGSVALTALGVPVGVRTAFGTNTTGDSVALSIVASDTAQVTTSPVPITVRGVIGADTAVTTININVVPAPFSVTFPPITVRRFTFSDLDTLHIARQSGFTEPITLSPVIPSVPGISVGFTPSIVQGTEVETFVAVEGFVLPGTYTLQVQAVASRVIQFYRWTITVVDFTPSIEFQISVESPVTVTRGGAPVSARVEVARAVGFTTPIDLSVSNLPVGVTARIIDDPLSGTTTAIELTATTAAQVGGTFTLRAQAGNVTRQVQGQVRVVP